MSQEKSVLSDGDVEEFAVQIRSYLEKQRRNPKPGDVLLPIVRAIAAAAAKAERERACEAIREACGMCNGQGYTETSHAAHGCGGDESLCASGCPVEQLEQVGCEYCGRPIEAIRAESE